MPKLLYFELWAKSASIKLLLKHANVDFVSEVPGQGDVKPWPEQKAEFPQRGGVPWFTNDKGETYTQSMSILRALAAENGYVADTPMGEYESDFTIDVLDDAFNVPGFPKAFFAGDGLTQEQRDLVSGALIKALDILDARWADGRKYVAGDKVTSGDFKLVGIDAGIFSNEAGAKNKDFQKQLSEELQKRPNVVRIIKQVRSENGLEDYIKNYPACSI